MRLLPTLGAFIVWLVAAATRAQEPALPKPDSQDPLPAPGASAAPSAPPQLIPPPDFSHSSPPIPNLPTIPQLDEAFKQSPLSVAAENSKHHLEWRALRNRVVVDREVRKALAAAEAARTDLEKRRLLRHYYELFFRKMIGLAATPELKTYLNERKNEHLGSLPQPRVRSKPSPSPKDNS